MFSKEITKKVLCASNAIKLPKQLRRKPGTHEQTERQTWQHCPLPRYHPTPPPQAEWAPLAPLFAREKAIKKEPAKRFRTGMKRPACGCQDVSKQKLSHEPVFSFIRRPFKKKTFNFTNPDAVTSWPARNKLTASKTAPVSHKFALSLRSK